MTDLFKTAALMVMSPYCYDQYFDNFNFFHGECMKSTISKLLGLAIIAGSVTVKVPQILKIMKNKSAEGITLFGSLLELATITTFFSYSYLKQFPFSAWGEGLFMAFQSAIVVALVLHYKNQFMQLLLFLFSYFTFFVLVILKVTPISFFWLLQVFNVPLVIAAKGSQAWLNYKNQSTGQLSFLTFFLMFGGCVARVFTSIQETGDFAIILTFLVACILNGIIVVQFYLYREPDDKKGKKKKSGERKKAD